MKVLPLFLFFQIPGLFIFLKLCMDRHCCIASVLCHMWHPANSISTSLEAKLSCLADQKKVPSASSCLQWEGERTFLAPGHGEIPQKLVRNLANPRGCRDELCREEPTQPSRPPLVLACAHQASAGRLAGVRQEFFYTQLIAALLGTFCTFSGV